MAYQALVIPVLIASPSDVSEEREIVRLAIHDWNDINASKSKIMLTPVGWESHSSPELGTRPQELINKRLLKECDLLIGVFWTRLGTPTGEAESGTVEEVEKHIASGKPAMLYFSDKPAAPQSINADQYKAVTDFKEKCKSIGIIEGFSNANELRSKLSKQIHICLTKNEYLKKIVETEKSKSDIIEHADSYELQSPSLSEEAKTIVKTAAKNEHGTILKIATMRGRSVSAAGVDFGGGSLREAAKWENALNELLDAGFVVERGYKGEVFELTHQGWNLADDLEDSYKK